MLPSETMYPYTAKEARERGELELWRANFRTNCACAGAIELAIRKGFDGMHLWADCAKSVIDQYGYKRVGFVLANTLQEQSYDGRYHETNKQWSRSVFVPEDGGHRHTFLINSHPAVLDGFVSEYRAELAKLHLFGAEHCEPNSGEQDFTGRVLILSPDTLRESYWQPENQLWLALSGFGCRPHARGRSVLCTCLGDGETTRWNRSEFVGIIRMVIGFGIAVFGIVRFQQGIDLLRLKKHSGWFEVVISVLLIAAGIIVAVVPELFKNAVFVLSGILMMVVGVTNIVSEVRTKKAMKNLLDSEGKIIVHGEVKKDGE